MIIVEFGPDGRKDRYDDDLSRSIIEKVKDAKEFKILEKFEIFCISDVLYQASKNLIDIPFDSIQSPLEKDAIRISKKVSYDLYEKNRIDSFAEEIRKKKEALEKQVLVISEVSKEGYVPELKVGNKRKIPVLLLGGEELAGAKQNRVLNTTM